MIVVWCRLALAALLLAAGAVRADDLVSREEQIVQKWGRVHADCAECSDACVVCRRDGDASACSTPGIACLPEPIACRTPVAAKP